jgi:twitching motility two-component system response regulator PilH
VSEATALKTILLVDDSPTELTAMRHALEGRGYELVTAGDGDQALEQIMKSRPALVLLDVVLPRKNGFQICRQIKSSPETSGIKVMLITSKSQETDRYWGMKQGADAYMTKPFDGRELAESVARLLG